MPIYDYIKKNNCNLTDCKKEIELIHKAGENVLEHQCSNCGKMIEVGRNYNAVPVHYKGKGFYSTDYKKLDTNISKFLPKEN
jgi:predicted nucleic acid-binding Zn ribbon protein